MKKLRFQTISGAALILSFTPLFAQELNVAAAANTAGSFPSVSKLGDQPHLLPVSVPINVDPTSLDGRDIWIVSLKGYNQLASFVRLEKSTTATAARAFYEVPAPEGGWKEGDELFTILLQPNEIRAIRSGSVDPATGTPLLPSTYFLPPSRLGDFRVVLPPPPPPPPPPVPPSAMVSVLPDSTGAYSAKVTVKLPATLDIAEWGTATRVGDIFTIASTTKAVEPAANAALSRVLTKSFPLDLTETPAPTPEPVPVVAADAAPVVSLPFEVVKVPSRSYTGNFVINSLTQWNSLWSNTINAANGAPAALPSAPVDFERRTLVGICLGTRNTGGFSAVVDSVIVVSGVVIVTWHEVAPKPGDPVTLAITYPAVWFSLAKEIRPIRFVTKTNVIPPPIVIPPVVTRVYTVDFTLDGKKLASTRFTKQPSVPPPPPVPFPAVKVTGALEGRTAKVTVTLATAADAARIGSWGEVERRDRVLIAKAVSRKTTDAAPAVVPPLTHTYEIADLADGAWQFLFTVDGYVAGRASWIVGSLPPPVGTPPVPVPGDPANGDPTAGLENGSAMILTFVRNPNDGSTFVVEVSTDLKTWTALDPDQYTTETRTLPDGLETVVIKLPETDGATRRYARLRVLRP